MFILIIILFILVCCISVYYFYLVKKLEEDIEDLYDLCAYQTKSLGCLSSFISNQEENSSNRSVLK